MKKTKDIITEEEFTLRMAPTANSPEEDSPGDSEDDAGSEFQMGADYIPDTSLDEDEDLEALSLSNIEDLKPKNVPETSRQIDDLPETAKVISSNQPSPWMDLDAPSDTN